MQFVKGLWMLFFYAKIHLKQAPCSLITGCTMNQNQKEGQVSPAKYATTTMNLLPHLSPGLSPGLAGNAIIHMERKQTSRRYRSERLPIRGARLVTLKLIKDTKQDGCWRSAKAVTILCLMYRHPTRNQLSNCTLKFHMPTLSLQTGFYPRSRATWKPWDL